MTLWLILAWWVRNAACRRFKWIELGGARFAGCLPWSTVVTALAGYLLEVTFPPPCRQCGVRIGLGLGGGQQMMIQL